MTTVLAVYNSEGVVGRCDARCHDAVTGDCDCICGGANHGRGTAFAIDNTRQRIDRFTSSTALNIFESRHHAGATRVEAMPDVTQLDLDLEGGTTR